MPPSEFFSHLIKVKYFVTIISFSKDILEFPPKYALEPFSKKMTTVPHPTPPHLTTPHHTTQTKQHLRPKGSKESKLGGAFIKPPGCVKSKSSKKQK